MARKTSKDYKIEALEAELSNYREKERDRVFFSSLSDKTKLITGVVVVLLLLLFLSYLYLEIKAVTGTPITSENEYQLYLMNIDSSDWKIRKSDYKSMKAEFINKPTGKISTCADGESLMVEIEGSPCIWANFSFSSGYIEAILNMKPALLYFSESTLRKGRALSIEIDGKRLIFYEKT